MTEAGYRVLHLTHEADPDKGLGPKTFVPEEKMEMSPWLLKTWQEMTDKSLFRQEILVDFNARLGELLFHLNAEATLEKSFPIPHNWTRYYGLDPHERKPHAHLWCAVDPFGDRWLYREFWPSKAYGKPGNIPEDDNRYTIKEHCEVIQYLESADNPENSGQAEQIYKRVIDYSARAMGKGTTDDKPQDNFQLRFEKAMREARIFRPNFVDCKKDATGAERVREGLKPLLVERDGKMVPRSRIHIFQDKCPELIYQLNHVRYKQLTPLQAEVRDPQEDEIAKRNDLTDLMKYIENIPPRFVETGGMRSNWKPIHSGVAY